jgi:hypothetical protein
VKWGDVTSLPFAMVATSFVATIAEAYFYSSMIAITPD